MNRFAVGMFAIAYVASAGKSASTESEAQYQDRKSCVAEPDFGICTNAVTDRKAYKALIELKAQRRQLATRSRENTENKLSNVVISVAQITPISVCRSLIFA
jgi:hypothetical protein